MNQHLKLPTLMIISENPSIRKEIGKWCQEKFFIIEADSERVAKRAVEFSPLDLILLDEDLENCDALTLCEEMRQMLHSNLLPIFLLTDKLKKSFRDAAKQAGITDFISKQLDPKEMEDRIAASQKVSMSRTKTIAVSSAFKKRKS